MGLINHIYCRIILPSAYYFRGDFRFYYYSRYKRNLKKTKKEIKNYQFERLKKLLRHAYETVPYYTELFDRHKICPEKIRTLEDFKQIPVLDKKTLMNNLDLLKSRKKYRLFEEYSGGSSGQSVVVYKDKRYHEKSRAMILRDFYSVGIQPGDKAVWIWGSPIENVPLKTQLMHKLLWKINRRIIFNASHYSEKELRDWLNNTFNKFKPNYIYGYASSLYEIAKFIKSNKTRIHQVKKIISTAERLEHRAFIETVFRCKVLDQYASREVNGIAIENDNKIMHSNDDFNVVELDDNNEIILTPLESYGMPLIRYKNGDIGIKPKSNRNTANNDTSPFNQFNIDIGRSCELGLNNKGEKVGTLTIFCKVGEERLNIGEFQVIQKSLDEVDLNIVNKKEKINDEHLKRIKNIISGKLGCSQINVSYLSHFPLEKSGKKISFKCMIPDKRNRWS